MDAPACKVPYDPRINSAEKQLACFSAGAGAGNIVEYPFYLCCRKIRVYDKTCLFLYISFKTACLEFIAYISGTPALPDYGVIHRPSGAFVPDYSSFTLVSYAYSGSTAPVSCRYISQRLQLCAQYLVRIVLDPAGLRVYLFKRVLRFGLYDSGAVENYSARACSALIERYYVFLI